MDHSEKFLIIGAGGLIGKAIIQKLDSNFELVGTTYSREIPGLLHLDITDSENVKTIFENTKPAYVIHCANLSGGVDFCEKNPESAKKFHFDATVEIGKQCLRYNAKFVFLSSECVFDGKKELYNEDDEPNPLNVYGKWKAKSEEWIKGNLKDYVIVRTMAVYGWDPKTLTPNTVMKVYFSILKEEKISVPDFRWGNPTYVGDLAKSVVDLALSKYSGIFHLAGTSFVSRYQWLKKTCEALGWDKAYLIAQKEPSEDDSLRPLRINLNTMKFKGSPNSNLHNLEEGLSLLKEDIERNE